VLSGACCLESKDGEEVVPPSVLNALVEAGLAASPIMLVAAGAVRIRLGCGTTTQVGGLDGLNVDHIILSNQGERRLVMEVAALPAHVLMLLG
jgi:hypothetical protein